VLADFV
jgi:small subunit ribosomal protein S19e